ncbi:hypothetical protein ES703_14598 [subsurface metagenome]
MAEVTYQEEIREFGDTYGVQEELLAADTKPLIKGTVAFWDSGQVNWSLYDARVYYRIYPDDKEGRILDCYVVPKFEGRGIATRLVQISEERMKSHGVRKIAGSAQRELHAFWRKLGYSIHPDNEIEKQL